jgi:hypothetical protein
MIPLHPLLEVWLAPFPRGIRMYRRLRGFQRETGVTCPGIPGVWAAWMFRTLAPVGNATSLMEVLLMWGMVAMPIASIIAIGHQKGVSTQSLGLVGLVLLGLHLGVALFRAFGLVGEAGIEDIIRTHPDLVEDWARKEEALEEKARLGEVLQAANETIGPVVAKKRL